MLHDLDLAEQYGFLTPVSFSFDLAAEAAGSQIEVCWRRMQIRPTKYMVEL